MQGVEIVELKSLRAVKEDLEYIIKNNNVTLDYIVPVTRNGDTTAFLVTFHKNDGDGSDNEIDE